MAKQIDKFEGLYGQRGGEAVQAPLYSERLEYRSHHFNWVIHPHIHPERFQIFFVENGEFQYLDGRSDPLIQSPCLLLIPAAVPHGFIFRAVNTGRILSISNSLINHLFAENEILAPLLHAPFCINSFPLNCPPEKIRALLEAVDEELFGDQKKKELMLHINLQQLFLVIYRLWLNNQEVEPKADNLTLKYFRKFQQLVREKEGKVSVTQLAAEIGVSKVHLNRICNEVSGKSASELIKGYILAEARKYLNYTSYSISEIAYILGFEYPNYFARFFKKHAGCSPLAFRNKRL